MKNMGSLDRWVRYGVALVLTGWALGGNLRYILWGIALVPLATASFGYCPFWTVFKINSAKK